VCTVVDAVSVDLVGWVPVEMDELSGGFRAVYEAEHRALLRLAYALTGQWAVAEDLTQEAFLRLHQRWGRVSRYERPGAWLRRVLVNLATSRARRLATEAKLLARLGRERPAAPALTGEGADFWVAVRGLPRRQAQAVTLFYLEDRPSAEIAAILGCSEVTVRAHLHQARTTLQTRLGLDDQEEAR
jgi:RNA polymerase sigma-70 factor (sigma-E family)